MSDNVIILFF